MHFLSRAVAFVCAALLLGLPGYSQVTTTSVVGIVTDTTGAMIPGATVDVLDVERNQLKSAITTDSGEYRIDFLLTGTYKVSVSKAGFKTHEQNGLSLQAGAPVTLNIALTVGQVSELVQVEAAGPLINTVSAEIGTTVDKSQITQLPLVNRNPYQLLDLTPGVQTNSTTVNFGAPAQVTLINGGSDNGAGSVNYFLDGAPNISGLRNTGNLLPNPDALEEFRVQTSNYGAPFGRFANGIVNALVKSGTNRVHGTLFEFFRNEALNARDWGSSPTTAKSPLHRNQFGATLGGPILMDRSFFFGSYAGLRQTLGTLLNTAILPTVAEATGDFRASARKPTVSCNGVAYVICAGDQDAAAVKLLGRFLPASNASLNGSPSWQGNFTAPYNTDEFLIKGNHRINARSQVAVTYFNSSGFTLLRGGSSNVPYATQTNAWRQQNAIVNSIFTFTPTLVNNVWLSLTRFLSDRVNLPAQSLASFGSSFLPQGTPSLPNIGITGYFTLGNSNAGPGYSNIYALRDVATWSKGKHSIQLGAETVLDKSQKVAQLTNFGSFTFNGGVTGNAFADYLRGIPSAAAQDAPASVSTVTFTTSSFFQDDFRFTNRLTLNLGFRWDIQTPPVDTANRLASFVPGQQSTIRPNAPRGLLFPGDAGIARGITPVSFKHFSPRIGFAYDPFGTGNTAIRGGGGIFWGSFSEEAWALSGNSIPFAIRYTFSNVSNANGVRLVNPYQNNPGGNPFPYTGGLYPVGGAVSPNSPHVRTPYTIQVNMQVQQQLSGTLALTVAYVGSLGRQQLIAPDLNYPSMNINYGAAAGIASCGNAATVTPSVSNVQCRRPYQPLGVLNTLGTSPQNSSYHSLQTNVIKRMSQHFSVSGLYVWAKALSTVQLEATGVGGNTLQNPSRPAEDRGRTDNDYRHVSTIALMWEPDYYQGKSLLIRNLLNGWEISPLARFRSGGPFSIANGADANLDGLSTDRAQLIGDPYSGGHTRTRWFNTAAFQQNRAVTGAPVDGNSARNLLTGPGSKTIDVMFGRSIPLTDKITFQFRAEASNALNIVNYSNPATTITQGATFGVISNAATMRQIQFGGKILF